VEIVESFISVEAVKVSDAPDTPDDAPKPKRRPLPLTETLVLDIVDYLLENEGYGYSTQISSYMVDYKPRRYTSREVVGILRNRPCFRHAQAKDRKGGIRWRLDVLALEKYLVQKGYEDRAEERGIYDKMRELKWRQIFRTIEALESMMPEVANPTPETINSCYENLATLWS
jgi:hypothetical protein